MSISIGDPIRLDHGRADSELRWATIAGKKVFILRQKGSFADISYDHGCLLANEIEGGVFPEIIDTIQTGTDVSSDVGDWILSAVYRRMSDDVFDACSGEFRAAVKALGDGMFDTLDNPNFTPENVRDALVAIDVGNLGEGLSRRMAKPLAPEVSETIFYVLGAARRFRRHQPDRVGDALGDKTALGHTMQRLSSPARRVGFGCTATGAAPALTQDGLGLHARTFDGAFFSWNRFPGLFLIDERETNASWHRYAAIGTAGLIYSGGISGMNDAGIAASIHQMSTARYDTGRPSRGYAVAPYLQQRILREAGSLDEAEDLLRSAKHFASWTIVVSDAKAGTSARFEINGGTQKVARMDLGDHFEQSNHFIAPGMAEQNDWFEDVHFTPTFGKWLETRARISTVKTAFAKGRNADRIGTDWAIDLMASHGDGALDGAPRSFGRTICKAYGLMGSVARADPDRSLAGDQLWMSIGDRLPGPHGTFAGFAIDWEALSVAPVADRPVRHADTVSNETSSALADYVAAFEATARPRNPAGGYLGRDPDAAEERALLEKALVLVDGAARKAEDAGETDVALRYARARLSHALGKFDDAARDWDFLRGLSGRPSFPLHPFEVALIQILSAATDFCRGNEVEAADDLADGKASLDAVRKMYFPPGTRPHADLDTWQTVIEALEDKGAAADLPEFEFVTVE
ncbi:MAG: carcinine hydrolase/isopenicillin-N N-acyltransferase family protein [Pseudomonadota bacterium]